MYTHLIVPDGVAIRNFFCSSFLTRALALGPVAVWHSLPDAIVAPYNTPGVVWHQLPAAREGALERTLRYAKVYVQLAWRADEDAGRMLLEYAARAPRNPANQLIHGAALTLGRRMASARGAARLDAWHAAVASRSAAAMAATAALRADRPDVLLCAHQRAPGAVPLMLAARKLGIPTATFIYSWDNLPKGRMAVHADHYLVWSERMAAEMARYYPEVARGRVHVVGTPQFEPYFDPALRWDRERFCAMHGLDAARPIVCFSGDDLTTSPHDPLFLRDLAEVLLTLPERPQLLFRRCPADLSRRYDAVLAAHPEIVRSEPRWAAPSDNWTETVPLRDDGALLANLARHCDLVVNLGSTMAIDFAIFDKPALYVAYNPVGAPAEYDIARTYALPHLRVFDEHPAVYWARAAVDLAPMVRRALAQPSELAAARRSLICELAALPLERASERMMTTLDSIRSANAPATYPVSM